MIENELPAIAISEAKEEFVRYLGKRNLGITSDDLFNKMTKRCDIVKIDRNNNIFAKQSYPDYGTQEHGFRIECEGKCHLMTCKLRWLTRISRLRPSICRQLR